MKMKPEMLFHKKIYHGRSIQKREIQENLNKKDIDGQNQRQEK